MVTQAKTEHFWLKPDRVKGLQTEGCG